MTHGLKSTRYPVGDTAPLKDSTLSISKKLSPQKYISSILSSLILGVVHTLKVSLSLKLPLKPSFFSVFFIFKLTYFSISRPN